MEVAALILSIISLIISVWVTICEAKRDYKIAKISIEYEFYREILKDHLIKKIPEARRVMWIDKNGNLKDDQPLIQELDEIRRDILYFRYQNQQFYNKLKEQIQKLEDFLIESEEKLWTGGDQIHFLSNVEMQLNDIYAIVSQAYLGQLD